MALVNKQRKKKNYKTNVHSKNGLTALIEKKSKISQEQERDEKREKALKYPGFVEFN